MARHSNNQSSPQRPSALDGATLDRLALTYVARYATTRKKLRDYLARKIRERGWQGDDDPPVDAIAEHMATLGYINDAAFAAQRGDSFTRRGYGPDRLKAALRHNGITDEDAADALISAQAAAFETAMAYARRKRIGPFGAIPADPIKRKKALAAMCRAGHAFSISRQIIDANVDFIQD
jgi:regulatory protein